MVNTFNSDKLTTFIDEFVSTVPGTLRDNPLTADLVGKVDRLSEDLETPFSLAVVGQMRIGKSSLMNGLIGKESAVVGVNETTATINFFKYGEGDLKNNFRVHWKNKHYEEFPCSAIKQWIGDSKHAAQSRFLEFFDDTDFFKEITLVDTPGTRSVIGDHSEMINSFLAEKRERETLQHGGKADAILYVSGAVANVSAEDMLKEFQDNTRLPGSSPYNSVAVLHKWETLNVERPYEEAHKKASLMEKQFQQFVAKVIPVSGPLALAAKTLEDTFWNDLTQLIHSSDHQKLLKILDRGDERFKRRIENGNNLIDQSHLPWPCFRVVIKHAIQEGIIDGGNLRIEVMKLSGIENLMSFIQDRFIEKSTQIKSLTALTKAIEPCRIAQLRLRNDIANKEKLLLDAQQSSIMLDSYITKEHKFLEPVSRFLNVAQTPFREDLERHKQTQIALGQKTEIVEECYRQIMGDLRTLALLESNASVFSKEEQREIRHICGSLGLSVEDRTSCYSRDAIHALETVEEKIEFWDDKGDSIDPKLKPVTEHMVSRLEELAEELENIGVDNE